MLEILGQSESEIFRVVELIILLKNGMENFDLFSVGWADGEFMTMHQLRILFCVELNERMMLHQFPIFLFFLRTNRVY